MRLLLLLLFVGAELSGAWSAKASEAMPPAPSQYVTDQAGVVPPVTVAELNRELAAFEKKTSNQLVAVVYPKLPEGTTPEDYAQSLYHAWGIGTKKNSNGVLILVFVADHKIRIQTGYGLEGALPDALCSRIIRETMAPAFRSGNYGQGLSAGIAAVIKATSGEYRGSGHAEGKHSAFKDFLFSPLGLFLIVFLVLMLAGRNRGETGGRGIGPGTAAATGFFLGGLGSGWGRGDGSGGGDSGGFSGGGGDSGGGGAGGDW